MTALEGLKVVDLSRVLGGPLCAQILGDHGAHVVKVEGPAGDETRTWGPPFKHDMASYFAGINRNKQAICVDLAQPQGRELLFRLLEDADVLIENFKSGTMERWGMGYREVLAERFPRLIHCRVTGYGDTGPLGGVAGYDAAVQAISGLMSINGTPEDVPTRLGVPIVDVSTGLNATIGILLALAERTRSGRGQQIESALFDCALASLYPHSINTLFSGRAPQRSGNGHPNIAPYDSYATRTESLFLAVGNNGQFKRLCEAVGRPELPADPRFVTNATRAMHRFELRKELEAAFQAFGARELFEKLIAIDVPCGVIHNVVEALAHPHTAHREMIADIDGHRSIASPIKLSRTPATYRSSPQQIGESTVRVLAEAGLDEATIERLLAAGIVHQAPPAATQERT
ncbi:MAG TPA: CoA transferase [Pseudorhodoferax sp.]|jgi:crotonobetainyl-CoA:carnitine CoA-transferase CaiB-like acyl-CoA transferase|nr:CoA transferase [Pseudorhodoferax sp.]